MANSATVKTISIDLGYKKLYREVAMLKGQSVEVGIQADAGYYKDPEAKGKTPKIVVIASTQEFGTKRAGKNHDIVIPQRSFIRSTVDNKSNEWESEAERYIGLITEGQGSAKRLLMFMGLRIESDIKARIKSGIPPPLKPYKGPVAFFAQQYQKRIGKGRKSPVPLWHTGQMLNHIRYISSMGDESKVSG